MPFSATVYRVLIASPGDVGEERRIIAEVISQWNAVHSIEKGIVLMPVLWESSTYPSMGGRPQSIVNKQIVENSDILIGVFWTRFGTPTGEADSGTAEEIQQFIDSGRPVMLYFSRRPIDPDLINSEQHAKVREAKAKYSGLGLYNEYGNPDILRGLVTSNLASLINDISSKIFKQTEPSRTESSKPTSFSSPKEHDLYVFHKLDTLMTSADLRKIVGDLHVIQRFYNSDSNKLTSYAYEASYEENQYIDGKLQELQTQLVERIDELLEFTSLNFFHDEMHHGDDMRFVLHPEKNPDRGRASREDEVFFMDRLAALNSIIKNAVEAYSKYRSYIKSYLYV